MKTNFFLPSYAKKFNPNEGGAVSDISFINIAYRKRLHGAATGGPNGVLSIQERLLGSIYRGFYLRYAYEPDDLKLPETWSLFAQEQKLGTMTKNLLAADHFVRHYLQGSLPRPFSVRPGAIFHFICHDIGSAAAAHMCGFPYTLIYHQQGSFIHERISFGEVLNEAEIHIMNSVEKIAFEHADKVYFPSMGAKNSFIKTTKNVKLENVNFSDKPLYNTVVDFYVNNSAAMDFLSTNGFKKLLSDEIRKEYIILISVGDYTENKGIDRCPGIISALSSRTSRKILWICMGSKHKSGIYEEFEIKKKEWPFEAILIPERQDHSLTMGLIQLSDWLFMMQRNSIFDFSTLETMKLGTGVILSPIGGNLEFNKDDNILYIDPNNINTESLDSVINSDPSIYGERNIKVFNEYFSPDRFSLSYQSMYDDVIDRIVTPVHHTGIPTGKNKIENIFKGKEVLICGPGGSLKRIRNEEIEGKILIALNSALCSEILFDVHIMQDEPKNMEFWNVYISKNVKRIYGKINRPSTRALSIDFNNLKKSGINYIQYELSSTLFDKNFDKIYFELDREPVIDMAGVVFSAIQIAVWGGASQIELAGIDFSKINFNGDNLNSYNQATYVNLAELAKALDARGIPFKVLHSDSSDVKEILLSKGLRGVPQNISSSIEMISKKNHMKQATWSQKRLQAAGPIKKAFLLWGDKILPRAISRPIDKLLTRLNII